MCSHVKVVNGFVFASLMIIINEITIFIRPSVLLAVGRVYKPRRRPKLRPKRSASWGEVVVIYIIVILSF